VSAMERVWIVTYDLPSSISYRNKRRKFYRRIHKWMKEHGGEAVWMTMSTIVTRDREFAEYVMKLIESLKMLDARASMFEAYIVRSIGVPSQPS